MAFNEYPYTDFHEMNLDWVIKKVKELAAAWAQVQQDWTDEQAAFANLQSWIENYFNNLNVQTEINVKLDAMVAAGTMSELIAPYVASGLPAEVAEQIGDVVAAQIGPVVAAQISAVVADQLPAVAAAAAAQEVSAWLALHVNPETGYVIDDTFTVQGAAADAKAVGDEFTAIKSALSNEVNYVNLISTMYSGAIGSAVAGQPFTSMTLASATNRIRSLNDKSTINNGIVMPSGSDVVVGVDPGYKYALQAYSFTDGKGTLTYEFKTSDTELTTNEKLSFVFVLAKENDADLTTDDASHIRFEYVNGLKKAINNKVDFSKAQGLTDAQKAQARDNIGAQLEEKKTIPFTSDLGVNIYKGREKYITDFNPQSKAITSANGVTVFMSPDGDNSNDGLTVNTPKKTFGSAVEVTNVSTIILLPGNYSVGNNFAANYQIDLPLNIIGVGEVTIDNGSGRPLKFTNNVYLENLNFKGGTDALVYEASSASNTICTYHCSFRDSVYYNGLSIKGGKAYIVECEASGNGYDGFNYHANDAILAESIEIDCVSYNNGHYNLTGSEGKSSNATTSHDGCPIIRVNGEYYACHGGVVADKECNAVCYGSKSGVSTITDSNYPDRMSNYWNSGGHTWLYDCISYGSKYDTAAILSGVITSNVVYPSNYPS